MDENIWEDLSPMCFKFRAYDVEENRDRILRAVEAALETFQGCEGVQIEITAPDRGAPDRTDAGGRSGRRKNAKPVVKGFAG